MMKNIYTAEEGFLYQHKKSLMVAKTLIIASNDSIENYNIIPEPEIELTAEEEDM